MPVQALNTIMLHSAEVNWRNIPITLIIGSMSGNAWFRQLTFRVDRIFCSMAMRVRLRSLNPMISMEIKPGLNRTGPINAEAARHQAEQAGYTVFVLPEKGIADRASFFEAVRATFPLDPPLVGSSSWDALSDSLWEGLETHSARRIAILWLGTRLMARLAPSDFDIALSVLADVAIDLADNRATCNNPKEIAVLVE
jgi:hypothetical protein